MRGAARLATYLGRVMIAVGVVVMFLGWNFAAGLDYAQGQLPFILSSSIPGLAMVVIGMSLEFVQTMRELTARRSREAAAIDSAMSRLLGFVRDGGGLGTAPAADTEITIPPGHGGFAALETASSAFAPPVSAEVPEMEPAQPVTTVIAGRSSFHDPACRLVTNRDDMSVIERTEAEANGLLPCRVCKP